MTPQNRSGRRASTTITGSAQRSRSASQLVAFVDESSRRLGASEHVGGFAAPVRGASAGDAGSPTLGARRTALPVGPGVFAQPGERIYLMAAAICTAEEQERLRAALRGLLLPRQDRLHWRDESQARRRQITAGIAALSAALHCVVVVAAPVPDAKQERARRLCLETLHPALEAHGVSLIVQEQRTPQQNRRDLQMVDALRSAHLLSAAVRVEFAQPIEEPLLWLPDTIAGAAGLAREGHPEHLARLSLAIQHHDVPMR